MFLQIGDRQLNKKLHQSSTFTTPLQKLDYSYNIRGWLNGVNKPYSDASTYDETDLFNFELHYNTTNLTGGNAQFNGNIAEQVWKGGYDEYLRGYKYGYDKANRLKTSGYTYKYLNSSNAMVWDAGTKYDENITSYDRNGNMKHLDRYHGSWGKVDDLSYNTYNGNQLGKVDDATTGVLPVGFTDKTNGVYDYLYDDNGNLYYDYNKSITMDHNHLNLTSSVDFGTKGNIVYTYNATGIKLQKTVTDMSVSPNKITITKYDGAFVYTNSYLANATPGPDVLEFIGHDEGRIRPAKIDTTQALTASNTNYIYDYFMKDHLGNTRMVLTTEQQTDLYAATQEPANATKENQLFNNLSSTTFAKPTTGAGFDAVAANTKVSRVNGGTTSTRIGPSIVLKVMAGDVISISTQAWYTGATVAPPTGLGPIKDQLLTLLSAGIVAGNGTHGGSIPLADISTGADGVLTDFLTNQTYNSSQPKAFLNWMIVDEEFKKVNSSFHMGAVQVPSINSTSMQKQQLTGPANMTVRRNGWLYVYVSNESNQDVYFDDLVINHKRGPVVEANNYYAFGLEIPGLTSRALGFGTSPQNRRKYNGIEFDADLDLNIDEAFYRDLDPQTGRWWQIDPKVDAGYENQSPYSSMYNNPVKISDLLGDEGEDMTESQVSTATEQESGEDGCCELLRRATISIGSTLNGFLNGATLGLWPAKGWVNTDNYSEQDKATVESASRIGQIGSVIPGLIGGMRSGTTGTPELAPINIKLPRPGNPAIPILPPGSIVPPNNPAIKLKAPAATAPPPPSTLDAHGQKKQSTGSTKKSGDNHMRQYKNNKKGSKENPNKKKGADERRTKNKPID